MKTERVSANGITLHVAQEGPVTGPLVVLLHGFPEEGTAWRPVMAFLAARGFRVWAPDMRGYGLSDRPHGTRAYATEALVADVVGLIDAAGVDRAAIVGHDWGGVVAWHVARHHGDRLSKLIILNAPHPSAMRHRLLTDPRQLARSWYVLAFQIPRLPELLLRRRDWRALADSMIRTSRPGTFTPRALREYRVAWSRPGAITAMIAYYRAALKRSGEARRGGRVTVPTLILWGTDDAFLVTALATDSAARCTDARVELVRGATHWLHHEEPERVSSAIASFLGPATA